MTDCKKDVLASAERWASVAQEYYFNREQEYPYNGERSYVQKVSLSDVAIYFRKMPGVTYCHHIPKEFIPYIEDAIKSNFEMLCAEALSKLKTEGDLNG